MLGVRGFLVELNDDVDGWAFGAAFHSLKIFGQLVLLSVSKGGACRKQANYNRHQYPSAPRRGAEDRGINEFLFSLAPSHGRTPRLCQVCRNVDFGITGYIEKRSASSGTPQGRGYQFCSTVQPIHRLARLSGAGPTCVGSACAMPMASNGNPL